MKTSVLQPNLKKALAACARVVDNRPTLPVLANVLLETDDARLRVSATNLEMSITTWVGAKIQTPGRITLPAKVFAELVANLSSERVDLSLSEKTQSVSVRCGGTKSNVKGIDADDFPTLPSGNAPSFTISAQVLKEMIGHVSVAVSKEANRPILTGIYMHIAGNVLTLASADGYRLAVRTAQLETSLSEDMALVIPARSLLEVARIITDDDYEVAVSLPGERDIIVFQTQHTELSSQILEGRFPDFTAIIPKSHSTITLIETNALRQAAKRAEIFARDNANSARMVCDPTQGTGNLTLTGKSAERGDNVAELDAHIDGAYLDFSFNVKYLIETLTAIGDERVVIENNGAEMPCLIRPDGRDDLLYVIMPMSANK